MMMMANLREPLFIKKLKISLDKPLIISYIIVKEILGDIVGDIISLNLL